MLEAQQNEHQVLKIDIRGNITKFAMVIEMAGIFLLFQILTDGVFLSSLNLSNLLLQGCTFSILELECNIYTYNESPVNIVLEVLILVLLDNRSQPMAVVMQEADRYGPALHPEGGPQGSAQEDRGHRP